MVLLGLLGLLLSGCVFFSDEPAIQRSDTFPGVGRWKCHDSSEDEAAMEIKKDKSGYWLNGEPARFKALEKGFYLLQVYMNPSEEIPGKRYVYTWVELAGNRLILYVPSMNGLTAAPSKALRTGVRLEAPLEDTPIYAVKGKPDQVLRFLTSFRKSELIAIMTCAKG